MEIFSPLDLFLDYFHIYFPCFSKNYTAPYLVQNSFQLEQHGLDAHDVLRHRHVIGPLELDGIVGLVAGGGDGRAPGGPQGAAGERGPGPGVQPAVQRAGRVGHRGAGGAVPRSQQTGRPHHAERKREMLCGDL